jgi:hypothetical protein
MPVPSLITDLATVAATNSPEGSETPSSADDYFRAHASFIAQLRAVLGGAVDPNIPFTQIAGARNKLVNGAFAINQRAVSGTVTLAAGAYGHDRWKAGASGCTYTFAASGGLTTITISAGSLIQVIEGANLATGTHVLTWAGSAQGKIGGASYSASGVSASVTGGVNLSVEFGTGTIGSLQLEPGSIPSAFELSLYGQELARCQRYCQKVGAGFTGQANGSTTQLALAGTLPVTMYASPTFSGVAGAGSSGVTRIGGAVESFTSYGAGSFSASGGYFTVNGSGYTLSNTYILTTQAAFLVAEL